MRKYLLILATTVVLILQTSCSVPYDMTKGYKYPKIYEEKPVSILVMPPINNTNNVEAKDLLYTSISRPIAEAGYYVIPPIVAMEVFKNESAYDAEYFFDSPLGKFKEFFGADAVVFTIIDKWTKQLTDIHTVVRYVIKSTATNEIIFDRTCDLTLKLVDDTKSGAKSEESLLLTITKAISTVIDVATTEQIEAARYSNRYIFNDLPYGKYSPLYLQDMEEMANDKIVVKTISR